MYSDEIYKSFLKAIKKSRQSERNYSKCKQTF